MKKVLTSILAVLVVSLSLPHVAWAEGDATSGTCGISTENGGKNVEWELTANADDSSKYDLNIKLADGVENAAMADFYSGTQPWNSYKANIINVVIENGVTSIGNSAFYGYTSLTSVTIPDSVTSIGVDAFSGCLFLTGTLTIPDSVTSIGDNAFSKCTGLKEVTIGKGVTSIGNSAFYGCSALTAINVDENNNTYKSIDGVLYSKDGKTLIKCPEGKTGTSYTIPDSVTSIGNAAFWDCSSLTEVTIPNSVTSIGISAFNSCIGLTKVTIPNSVTSIGNYVFYRCTSLTSVNIGNCVTSIGNSAFSYCTGLTSVTIPNSVTSIGNSAFSNCAGLTKFFYPEGLEISSANVPATTNQIAYTVTADTGYKTVKLVSATDTSNEIELPCNAMGPGYEIDEVDSTLNITADKHNFSGSWTDANDGVHHKKTCSVCGDVKTESHTYGGDTTVAATCTQDGYITRSCQNCDHIETETLPATGHSFTNYVYNGDATCTTDGTETATCDNTGCNETHTKTKDGSALGHDFGEWEITTEPSCTEAGEKTRTCQNCDHIETNTISANGHNYVETVVAPTETTLGGTLHKCSRCGDEYWTDFTKDDNYAQTIMPNGETVYHYSTHNGLATETIVDLGDGQTLRVFLQDPLGVLKKNDTDELDVVVTYIKEGSARYNELMSQIDGDHPVEHIKFFNVYPTVNGVPVTGALDGSIYMEYEIPEGWDESDLEMILVQDGDDQEFDETVLEIDGKRYLAMWKNHFSPYAMIDKLSAEEQAALNIDKLNDEQKAELENEMEELASKLEEQSTTSEEAKSEASSSSSAVKTGDETGYIVLMSSSMALIAGLYLELCLKKKRN